MFVQATPIPAKVTFYTISRAFVSCLGCQHFISDWLGKLKPNKLSTGCQNELKGAAVEKATNRGRRYPELRGFVHFVIDPKCTHSSLSHNFIRGIFLESLYSINSNFTNMSYKALFLYIMSMCDQNILNLSASYIENIQNCYASEL